MELKWPDYIYKMLQVITMNAEEKYSTNELKKVQ